MITLLVDICHLTELHFFLVINFKIYSLRLSNMKYSINSCYHAVHCISVTYFITGSLYLLTSFAHFPTILFLATTNLFSV